MSIAKMKKEELELLSNKDITFMILEESGKTMNTAQLFKKIIKILGLDEKVFEEKIGDYYTSLATDKRFILLEDGKWDLRNNHTSDKVLKSNEAVNDDDEEEDDMPDEDDILDEENEDDYSDDADDDYDEAKEDLKDLVVIDEDDIDLEQ